MPRTARNRLFCAEQFLKGKRERLQAVTVCGFIDIHGEREKLQRFVFHDRAVNFLVGKVPPTPDRLRKHQADNDTIPYAEEVYFFKIANRRNRNRTAQNTADNRKPTATNPFKREPIFDRHAVRQAIKKPCRAKRDGQAHAEKGQEQIGRNIPAFKEQRNHEERRENTANDNNRVSVDFKTEYVNPRVFVSQKSIHTSKFSLSKFNKDYKSLL